MDGDIVVFRRANIMERMLIKKLRMVSLKANQLSKAYLVILVALLVYIFFN